MDTQECDLFEEEIKNFVDTYMIEEQKAIIYSVYPEIGTKNGIQTDVVKKDNNGMFLVIIAAGVGILLLAIGLTVFIVKKSKL